MTKKQRRDKWGRFAPKRGKKLKPLRLPKRNALGKFIAAKVKHKRKHKRFRLLQAGKWFPVEPIAYYAVIHALVPGGWATSSTPAFITDAPEEALNMIIWRTPLYPIMYATTESQLLKDLADGATSLSGGQLARAEMEGQEIIVLSTELRCLYGAHKSENFLIASWPGIKPPRKYRNVKQ